MNWTRKRLAEEYGRALGEDIQEETIRIYEQRNTLPTKHLNRRAILAGLLGLTPMTLGVTVPPKVAPRLVVPAVDLAAALDVAEYRSALTHYWHQGVYGALEEIARRVVCLHNKVPYVRGAEQQQMTRLLCGFNSLTACELNRLGFYEIADSYHTKAIRLAIEKNQYDVEGFARWQQAINLVDRGHYEAALRTLERAKALQNKLPGPLNGYVTCMLSEAHARTAQDKAEVAEAMAFADEAEQALGEQTELNSYLLRFDRVRYVLQLSMVFVGPARQALHLPDEALNLIEAEVPFFGERRFEQIRQIFCNLIQARAAIDKKEYAYGANLLIDMAAMMEELHSTDLLPDVEALYQRLKETSYKHSVEVARLGLALTQVKYPELF
ncbi:MAG: hypothetical protein JO202_07895 [Ktedonobacteraceae bacterium]|nr:hypothetical protein [Ktedonobacteraceae bacterium]